MIETADRADRAALPGADGAARRPRDDRRPRALHRRWRAATASSRQAHKLGGGVPAGRERRRRRGGAASGRRRRASSASERRSFRRWSLDRAGPHGGARGGPSAGDGREGPERLEERDRRDPRRRRRRRGRAVRGRPLPDADQVRGAARRSRARRCPSAPRRSAASRRSCSRSRATAPTASSSTRPGVHRVQRVPKTESQGRIHTSTATVAVLPEVEDVEVDSRPQRPPDRRLPLVRARAASR